MPSLKKEGTNLKLLQLESPKVLLECSIHWYKMITEANNGNQKGDGGQILKFRWKLKNLMENFGKKNGNGRETLAKTFQTLWVVDRAPFGLM